ncbi:SLATT domain-containing protein [Nocardia sp. NPDC003726]
MSAFAWAEIDADSPEEAVNLLRSHVEEYARALREWYLSDKRWKRRLSRMLRAAAIFLAALGGLAPLVTGLVRTPLNLQLGYACLGLAASCYAFDSLFGLSSAWIRDISAAQSIDACMMRFHVDWLALTYSTAPEQWSMKLERLRELADTLTEILRAETGSWQQQFEGALTELERMVAAGSNQYQTPGTTR